jgi:hypothetical protein
LTNSRPALHAWGAGALTVAMGLLFWLRGPLPTVNTDYSLLHQPSLTYMVLAFPLFGAVCAEWWLQRRTREGRILLAQLAVLSVMAVGRLALGIPVSGHVLMGTFFILWAPTLPHKPLARVETALGGLALLYFLHTKMVAWEDFRSSTGGLIAGALVAGAGTLWRRAASTST